MENLLIYILQVNVLLSIVYLGYLVLLKGLTFYNLNRSYFIIGMLFSFIYPFLDIKSWFVRNIEPIGELMDYLPFYEPAPVQDDLYSVNNLFLAFMAAGATFFFLRLLMQSASVLRIHWNSSSALWHTFSYRNVRFPVAPFSFLRQIYLYRKQHDEQELTHIFKHELVHTNGLHSLDVLLTELVHIICWYNPLVHLMRKAIHQNLEFLTDQQVLDLGIDRQSYQYNLLHVNRTGLATPITNKFNFKMLKQRIMMMNKKRSSKIELSKYAMLIPVLVLASAAFTINQVEANIQDVVEKGKMSLSISEVSMERNAIESDTIKPDTTEVVLEALKADTTNPVFVSDGENPKEIRLVKSQSRDTTKNDLKGEVKGVVVRGVKGDSSTVYYKFDKNAIERQRSGPQPLMIVDGVPQDEDSMAKINPNQIESVSVLKDKSAEALYGEKGKNGVVLITTKKFADHLDHPVEKLDNRPSEIIIRGVANTTKSGKHPLVIVDGVVKKEGFDVKTLDPNTIESMNVWKAETATDKYGEKGANGVVEITTNAKVAAEKSDNKK
ncbi:TonB-dependent receptor plug domain-containing protein [Sphingobacterium sp. lm-10]|uniref:M56 family metallopeptidase n=1 Tax=Sphingobacterium sp. lm-10 TaxID=2944904 RepID=UPI00202240AE|nr:M56 family metallopeptidase [Sphingobacterium sp. lm-10]MCL7988025.1 TonB-dependent receptor plug domain-containing protein [Sphingobacterium sp. lm-10]